MGGRVGEVAAAASKLTFCPISSSESVADDAAAFGATTPIVSLVWLTLMGLSISTRPIEVSFSSATLASWRNKTGVWEDVRVRSYGRRQNGTPAQTRSATFDSPRHGRT